MLICFSFGVCINILYWPVNIKLILFLIFFLNILKLKQLREPTYTSLTGYLLYAILLFSKNTILCFIAYMES